VTRLSPFLSSAARARSAVLLVAALTVHGCTGSTAPPPRRTAQLNLQAVFSAAVIATLVVVVTAPDIADPGLVFNLEVSNGTASGTFDVPTGSNRLLSVSAYDASNVKTHAGSKTVNVQPGSNPTLSITLTPLAGAQPITVTFSSFVIGVSPATASIAVAATTSLAATVSYGGGAPIPIPPGDIKWATAHPAVARVSSGGVVTGVAAGTAMIMATYNGVGAAATVTVRAN
jgi:hypothetical protein